MQSLPVTLLAAGLAISTSACSSEQRKAATPAATDAAVDHSDPISSAMAAAPAAIASGATIAAVQPDGTMKILRVGNNGFTCMPDSPATPGPDPMCMDTNALKWAEAWMGHKPPPQEMPGVMYMLAGGTDASNTDPYATAPTKEGDWIKTGPHLMLVGSAKALAGYPSGASPDTASPYVMWAGTPYAHLMIPVS